MHPRRLPAPVSSPRPLLVLALESSADDSSASIVAAPAPAPPRPAIGTGHRLLSLSTLSQHALNSIYGGIHPLHAQVSHSTNIPRALARCLQHAKHEHGVGWDDIDAVAYTRGPGMPGCLSVGQGTARALAAALGKRLVGVHHMVRPVPLRARSLLAASPRAHTPPHLGRRPRIPIPHPPPLRRTYPTRPGQRPVQIQNLARYTRLQNRVRPCDHTFRSTADPTPDAGSSDVFEKSARLLALPSGPKAPGAILEHYASLPALPPYDTHPLPASQLIPIPLTTLHAKNTLAWSFAGMLAALQRAVHDRRQRQPAWDEPDRRAFANLVQTALTTHLLTKLAQRIALLPPDTRAQLSGIVVSGGVASNAYIRSQLDRLVKSENGLFPPAGKNLYYPPLHLCTDNAAMIAHTALIRLQTGLRSDPDDLKLRAKWSLEDMYDDVPEEAYMVKGAKEVGMGL